MNKSIYIIIFLCLFFILDNSCFGQIKLNIPKNYKFDFETFYPNKEHSITYLDTLDKFNSIFYSVFSDSTVYISYIYKDSGSSYYYNSEGKTLSYGFYKEEISTGFKYDDNGNLLTYSKEYTGENESVYIDCVEKYKLIIYSFYPNGVLKSILKDTKTPHQLIEYWDNGAIHIITNNNMKYSGYFGNYIEYDRNGKIISKGQYGVDELMLRTRKIGVWKYYENGKCVKKEKYDKNGNLI